jgi:hypothetical protein
VFQLDHFTLEDTYRLAAELRDIGISAASGDEAAHGVVSYLFEHLGAAAAPACPSSACFARRPGLR